MLSNTDTLHTRLYVRSERGSPLPTDHWEGQTGEAVTVVQWEELFPLRTQPPNLTRAGLHAPSYCGPPLLSTPLPSYLPRLSLQHLALEE